MTKNMFFCNRCTVYACGNCNWEMVSKCNSDSEYFRETELPGVTLCLLRLAKVTPVSAALRGEKQLLLSLVADCWPGNTALNWSIAFSKPTAQSQCSGKAWQVLECISNSRQSRSDLNNCAGLFVAVCWVFWSSICHVQVGKEVTAARCVQGSAVTEAVWPALGCWSPSALSAAGRGTWRCNCSSESSFESSSEDAFLWVSGALTEYRDCTDT